MTPPKRRLRIPADLGPGRGAVIETFQAGAEPADDLTIIAVGAKRRARARRGPSA